jgi:hypothetical protein
VAQLNGMPLGRLEHVPATRRLLFTTPMPICYDIGILFSWMLGGRMSDVHTPLTPEVQALLRQMDQALMSIPPEHCERIVRELLAELHQKIAILYHTSSTKANRAPETVQQLRTLRQELMGLKLQQARFGISAPRELEARIGQIREEIHALEAPAL